MRQHAQLISVVSFPAHVRPMWEGVRRELKFKDVTIKGFRQPAHNQETILAAFQEESWPARIDNPLAGCDRVNALDRLHDTVRRLNNHVGRVLLFMCDGLGTGITWEVRKMRPARERPRSAP